MKLIVSLDRDEDDVWIAECPSIPGCVSQGATRENALVNVQEAIGCVLNELRSVQAASLSTPASGCLCGLLGE